MSDALKAQLQSYDSDVKRQRGEIENRAAELERMRDDLRRVEAEAEGIRSYLADKAAKEA